MLKKLYMKVTTDRFELPLIVCDSAGELAAAVGTDRNVIYSSISHRKKDGRGTSYRMVEVDIEQEELE